MSKTVKHSLPKEHRQPTGGKLTEEQIRMALHGVMDPELGASLVDLDMVRRIEIAGGKVSIDLVLTVPQCPLADIILGQAREAVAAVPGVQDVDVRLLDEPYEPQGPADFQDWLDHAFGRRA